MISSPLVSLILAAASLGQVVPPTEQAAEDAGRKERQAIMKERAAELALYRGSAGKEPLTLTAEPVLRYSNAEREIGSLDGLTFLWLVGQRPVAAVSLSVRRVRHEVYRECTSLVGEPLECRSGETAVWSPKAGGLLAQPLEGAPTPAAGKPQRLAQMRSLARRFTASCYNSRTDEPTELRLLPQPLYRYADEKERILDGGLFAFVVSNDPELFLLLEAASADATSEPSWRYGLARMSSLKETVRLDDKEVWTVPNFYRDPNEDRKTGPYIEARVGTFTPLAAPPE
jgi:hypothetical protein